MSVHQGEGEEEEFTGGTENKMLGKVGIRVIDARQKKKKQKANKWHQFMNKLRIKKYSI